MTSWTKYPVMQGLTALLITLAILLASMSAVHAGQTRTSQTSFQKSPRTLVQPNPSVKVFKPRPSILTQYINRQVPAGRGGKGHNTNTGGNRGGGGGGGGGGISIGIDVLGIINNPGVSGPPRPNPPRKVYKKPAKKKTKSARRRPSGPIIIQTIPQFIANEVVVLIAGTQPDGVDDALAQSLGLTKLSSTPISLLEGRLVRYRIPPNLQLPQVIASLTSDARVSLAQPNNIYLTVGQKSRAAKAPTQYSLAKLGLAPVHKISQGRGVSVAVIDTGVDVSHPTLAKTLNQSFNAVGDGKPKAQRHGTAIAGLIAGQGKVQGVAPLSSLLVVRAFYMHPVYKRPVTSSAILLRALDWAFANKARIINMSFAGPFDPLVKAALTSVHNKGLILVAAVGNGGPKAAPAYPAAYENVIAITALDHKDKLYAHANHGSYLTAAAPGVDVLVPSLKKGYRYSSGTSIAAAHISGLVALLLERHPEASAEAVVNALQKSAHDLGPKGHDVQFGAGRADAHASLLSLSNSQVKLTSGQ